MKIFEFEIKETLSKTIKVESKSKEDAYNKIQEMYKNEEIVLDSSDYIETEIEEIKNGNI